MDQCKKGEQRTIDQTTRTTKDPEKIHETSQLSIWDRRGDLFKLFESSSLSDACIQCFLCPLWILNHPCNKYSSLDRVLVQALFLSATEQRWTKAFFSLRCYVFFFVNPWWLRILFVSCRAITLDNQLVVLATTATDAGRYHVEAVNEMTGENVTSPAVYLSMSGKGTFWLKIKCIYSVNSNRTPDWMFAESELVYNLSVTHDLVS